MYFLKGFKLIFRNLNITMHFRRLSVLEQIHLNSLTFLLFLLRRCRVPTGILLHSRSHLKLRWRFWRCFLSRVRFDSSFGITWFSIGSLKMFARKLISHKACGLTHSEHAQRPFAWAYRERRVCFYVISAPLKSWNPCYNNLLLSMCSAMCRALSNHSPTRRMRFKDQMAICDWTWKKRLKL